MTALGQFETHIDDCDITTGICTCYGTCGNCGLSTRAAYLIDHNADRQHFHLPEFECHACFHARTGVVVPHFKHRSIQGERGNYKVAFYATEAKCKARAQVFADRNGETIIVELWDPSHPQDDLNRGWAMTGSVHPRNRFAGLT